MSGKFTDKQKVIYNAVWRATKAVLTSAKAGVAWPDMHLLANREVLLSLLEAGILKGDIDDMMAVNLAGRVFQPHGLGHFMGMDVHDVGGYLEGHPDRRQGPGLRNLRTARVLQVTHEGGLLNIMKYVHFRSIESSKNFKKSLFVNFYD